MFHFNKGHLTDETIPMWVLKFHGETYYVDHVDCEVSWSTKETPDNTRTKGSIKVKDCLITIDDDNCARITKLTLIDKVRLRNQKLGITRVITRPGSPFHLDLTVNKFKHGPFKTISGACTSPWIITDLLDKKEATFVLLKYGTDVRVLMPNEYYYKAYDDAKGAVISADYDDDDTPYEYS